MKKVFVIYLPIILLTLLFSLPFIFPARLIALALIPRFLTSGGQPPDQAVTLVNLQGVLSEGSAEVLFDSIPLGSLTWITDLQSLLSGDVKLQLSLASDSHQLQTIVIANGERLIVEDLHGYIRAASVNPFSTTYGLTLEGELKLSSVNLALKNGWLRQLSGNLGWSGGTVWYRAASASANYQLKPLTGDLSLPEQTAILVVHDAGSSAEVLNVHLTARGWATVTILRRFFDLAGKQWIITDSADDIALKLEQKLW